MSGDRWTVLLMRDEDSSVRQFSVRSKAVRWLGIGAASAGFLLAALLLWAGLDGATRLQLHQLRQRNDVLSGELVRMKALATGIETSVQGLARRDAELRTMAGLDPIDDDVLRVGVGGPGLGAPRDHPLWALDASAAERAFAVDYDLNAIERRLRLLRASMDEAGDSLAAHRDLLLATPSILPANGYLSSRFSRSRIHPIFNQALPHWGIDIAAARGTPILAAAKGRVVRAGWVAGYGQMIEIDHGFGFTTRYGHASKLLVRVGQRVERGDIIGQVGSSGTATSPNLHYEVRLNGRPQNPMNYILSGAVP